MLCFYKVLNDTTPITAASIGVMTPIMVLFFSVVLLKEKLHLKRMIGLVIVGDNTENLPAIRKVKFFGKSKKVAKDLLEKL